MTIPSDYYERVYAGVLGKIIGVYLGRPFEGWSYDRIMAKLGEIWYYVHEKLGVPLIVTDDDISFCGIIGTFFTPMPSIAVLQSMKFCHGYPPFICRRKNSGLL